MPGRILDVGWIDRVVRRELRGTFVVASEKIQPDPPLPENGRRSRHEHDEPIEIRDRFGDPAGAEVRFRAVDERLGRLARRERRRQDERRANDDLQHGRSHDEGPDCRTGHRLPESIRLAGMIARWWKWILLACAPVAVVCNVLELGATPLFVFSSLAVVPLAAIIGESTGHLAHRLGPSSGALINATFGNLAEMIIAIFAVRAGLLEVVKASLTGSILGNLLFVGGLSMLVGGWKRESQKFNRLAAEASAGQMVVAIAALLLPAMFFRTGGGARHEELMHEVSVGTAIVLLITYGCGLWFTFRTHQHLLRGGHDHGSGEKAWPVRRAVLTLIAASIVMAFVAEGLVGAVEEVGVAWGLNEVFLGVVVLAMIGNAAENS